MHTPQCGGGNFHAPGIPGAGNALDPAVRAAIREHLQEILPDLIRKVLGEQLAQLLLQNQLSSTPKPTEHEQPTPTASAPRGGRQYYFMSNAGTNFDPIVPEVQQGIGPKPG